MPKLKAPEGSTSCSFDGESYKADADGVVTVPDAAVPELMAHGFTPAPLSAEEADKEVSDADAKAANVDTTKLEVATDVKKGGKK